METERIGPLFTACGKCMEWHCDCTGTEYLIEVSPCTVCSKPGYLNSLCQECTTKYRSLEARFIRLRSLFLFGGDEEAAEEFSAFLFDAMKNARMFRKMR